MDAVKIHPFDMYALLAAPEGPDDIIMHNLDGEEVVVFGDKKYRMTIYAPVESEEGKKLLARLPQDSQELMIRFGKMEG